jgi:2TM domain-containing protein
MPSGAIHPIKTTASRSPQDEAEESAALRGSGHSSAGRLLRGFRIHLLAYFAVMAVLVVVNLATGPANPWFVWPMVGWGGVLAIHAAYAMGLFGGGGGS